MTTSDIIRYRLYNQQIAETKCTRPEQIVSALVAMQAQEFAMARWAIGLRLPASTAADVEMAFDEGTILRTHLMRPTWHFVTPADIRWLLALTAPRVNAANAYYYRKFELDAPLFNRSNDLLAKTLEGGKHLTRTILKTSLERSKIKADGLRLAYILMRAELDAIICSGPRQGKQFTYALLEERVPAVKKSDRTEALSRFTTRFFASRGPATLQDFVHWSGLTMKEAREGAALLPSEFIWEEIEGQTCIYKPLVLKKNKNHQTTFLLPDYDEYGMSYKDRSAIIQKNSGTLKEISSYSHMIVIDGKIAGTWRHSANSKTVGIETTTFTSLNQASRQALKKAVERYIEFNNTKSKEKKPVKQENTNRYK